MALDKDKLNALKIDRDVPQRKNRTGLIVLVVLVIAAAAWFLMRPSGPKVVKVTTAAVVEGGGKGGRETVLNATGYVVARRKATVSSKITGRVTDVLIEEGLAVEQGQVLARLESVNVEVALQLAEARTKATSSALRETEVRIKDAKRELARAEDLLKQRVGTQAQFDRAEAEVQALEARLAAQNDEVTVARREVAVQRQNMDDTIIRAPFSGVVVTKDAQPGEMISPVSAGGGFTRTGIGTLVDMSSLEIEVDVNESYINRVSQDQAVSAVLDAWPNDPISGRVIAIVPTADRQKATVRVRIGFDQLDDRILPDMGIKVAFREGEPEEPQPIWREIPKRAVVSEQGTDYVWVVQNATLEKRAVALGQQKGDQVRIEAGLSSGERVALDPTPQFMDGGPVQEVTP